MVSLHILQLLQDNGFGTIDTDLFFETLALDKKGLYIVSRGSPLSRGVRTVQTFDIYARGYDNLLGAQQLEDVLDFLKEAYSAACDLPTVPGRSNRQYTNCSIQPTSNVTNVELDPNNRVIYMISGQVTYNKVREN